jgi:hypothetical protein
MKSLNSKMVAPAATLAIAAVVAPAQAGNRTVVVQDRDPFTHVARIPVGSELSSIRFQGAKVVTIPTKNRLTTDAHYCEEAARRDSGGSMFCPAAQPEAFTRALQVTYSYEGRPLASDESGNRRFTFSVYFRPEELGPAERELVLRRKGSREDAAGYFKVTTARGLEQRLVVDEGNSTFCEGTYVDGIWVHTNPNCEDNVTFKTTAVSPDYISVRVDPAPLRGEASAALVQ